MILGQKLTINHPSLIDEEDKTRVLLTAPKERKRRGLENLYLKFYYKIVYLKCILIKLLL